MNITVFTPIRVTYSLFYTHHQCTLLKVNSSVQWYWLLNIIPTPFLLDATEVVINVDMAKQKAAYLPDTERLHY